MKKNSLFLLAFVIFIFIYRIVKIFWDCPLWPAIIAAITSASWLFTFAEMFDLRRKFAGSIVGAYADCSASAVGSLRKIKRAVETHSGQMEDFFETDTLHEKTDKIDRYSSVKESVEFLEGNFAALKEKAEKEARKESGFKFASDAVTVLGFLVLFCVLFFEPVAGIFVDMQDDMTVGAFGLILALQFGEVVFENKLAEMKNGIKISFDVLEALKKNLGDKVEYTLE